MIRFLPMDSTVVGEVAALEQEISHAPWSVEMFLEEIRLGGWLKVMISGERTLAGYAVARPLFDEWHLLTLGVASAFRRQGLGRGLVEALIQEVAVKPGQCVVLEVRVSNMAARALYQGLGFVSVGVRRGYYRFGPVGPEDAVVMIHSSGLGKGQSGKEKIFLA
ncbi:MAG: ribosomal protein S18-alanine N-acetyltransferase [Magnetococcales bacterium]|nr:ribosomal protein S18-alanine N-acetyltransferase [Magnetococcales bacterium]